MSETEIPPMPRDPDPAAERSDETPPAVIVDYQSGKGIKLVSDKFEELRQLLMQMKPMRGRALALTSLETSMLWVGRECSGRMW